MSFIKFSKTKLINLEYSLQREILRTNNNGCYACTTIVDCNTRKYHGLLVCPIPELDGGQHVMLSSLDETIIQHEQEFNLALHKYAGDNYEPKGHKYIHDFTSDPIPKLLYRVGDIILSKERILVDNEPRVLTRYTLVEAQNPTKLKLKPFLAFRNTHALSKANMDINTKSNEIPNGIASRLYSGYPELNMQISKSNEFVPAPDWYYNIEYIEEQKRGYEYKEDLFVPGYFEMTMKKGESIVFSAGLSKSSPLRLKKLFVEELNKRIPRDDFNNCLSNTVKQFFIESNNKKEIISGFPWLTTRLRDTFVALPGLALANKDKSKFEEVISSILKHQKGYLFSDEVETDHEQAYAADISLWFIWSLQQLKQFYPNEKLWVKYGKKIKTIINGYLKEKDHFEVKKNGLIYTHPNNNATTWMNAKSNNAALINRNGYIVETNALWYNAICFASKLAIENNEESFANKCKKVIQKIEINFEDMFWDNEIGYLADFVNSTEKNLQLRPNQVFATSLIYSPLSKEKRSKILAKIEQTLLVPYGLRTLAPTDSQYQPKYKGNHDQREWAAYNGSVWPWLFTQYFEGLYKVYPKSALRASKRFMDAMKSEVQKDGLCSISELYHGDPPHKAKGAISFAKNTGELLRLKWLTQQIE